MIDTRNAIFFSSTWIVFGTKHQTISLHQYFLEIFNLFFPTLKFAISRKPETISCALVKSCFRTSHYEIYFDAFIQIDNFDNFLETNYNVFEMSPQTYQDKYIYPRRKVQQIFSKKSFFKGSAPDKK